MARSTHAHAGGPTRRRLTIQEYASLPDEDAYRTELVRGMLVREPRPGPLHGRVYVLLARFLDEYAETSGRGVVFGDTGFVVEEDPPTVRGPDLSYVTRERIPDPTYAGGFWHIGPDLAVEILSPSNRAAEIRRKVREYFAAGSRLVWIVDPRRRVVTVHEASGRSFVVASGGQLEGGDVVPGFALPLSRLFAL